MPCDYSKYAKNWWTEIRPRILKRAGNKCEFCGLPNYCVGYRTKSGRFVPCADPIKFACRETYAAARELLYDLEEHEPLGPNDEKGLVVVLTIAHLDHNPTSTDESRMKLLCQQCHLRWDAQHHQRNAAATRRSRKAAADLFEEVR